MPIYVEWDGIKGDVTAEGYADQIEVHSFHFGIHRQIGSPMGGNQDRESSPPSVSEVTISKSTDAASTGLFEAALYGEGKTVTLSFVKTDSGQLETFLSYELDEVLISGYSMSSGGDNPSESVTLNFTKIIMKNTPTGSSNETGTVMPTGWNLGTQQKM
jgi:type VI secretion system secreted protein Hcp